MIVGVEGRPGAGKSYWAIDKIVESLRKGRKIVTNMANVDFKRMCFDITGRNISLAKKLYKNVTVIPTKGFLEKFGELGKAGKLKNADVILDEVMLDFFSRNWQKMPTSTVFFLTQHRKYRCDFYYLTQSISRIDSVLKSLTQYYIRLRNSASWKFGPFKLPCVMVATWFQEDETTIHKNEFRRPNKKYYGYYDTYAIFENDAMAGECGHSFGCVDISYNGELPIPD